VRRLVKIALVVLGIRAFLRWRRKRREREAAAAAPPPPDPADELRRKLAESRTDDGAPEAESVEDRRAEVHEHGRAAADEMTSSGES
jgi:hypothetical protein